MDKPVIMKTNLCLFWVALLLQGTGAFAEDARTNEWGPTSCGAQMSLRLASGNHKARLGRAIRLSVRVKNVSDRTIIVTVTTPRRDYIPVLTDSSRNQVRPKPRPEDEELPSRFVAKLKPGEVFEDKIDLRELYTLGEPGRYTLVLARTFLRSERELCKITSNRLSIELTH
jgi:hypothetical protein